MKTLVVFYSRTGHTRDVGHRVATALHADIEEIADRVNRRGILGYLRSGREAWLRRRTELQPVARDPSAYDLVVVGTPVWSASLSSPVLTYLQDQKARLHDVAFFCTMGGAGSERVFDQMREQLGKPPIATLAVSERELRNPDLPLRIRTFVHRLRAVSQAA